MLLILKTASTDFKKVFADTKIWNIIARFITIFFSKKIVAGRFSVISKALRNANSAELKSSHINKKFFCNCDIYQNNLEYIELKPLNLKLFPSTHETTLF